MNTRIIKYLVVSFLVFPFKADAEMIGSCLIKDRKDENTVTHCEAIYEDEGYKIAFGEDSKLLTTLSEIERNCIVHGSQKYNSWELKKQCPTDNLLGVCHDQSGVWGGSFYYYEAYLASKRVSLGDIKDQCISGGKVFTQTAAIAEYEEAKAQIPTDLATHKVLATCIMPWPKNPDRPGSCEQYHEFTETKTLENRKSDCLGNPSSQWEMNQKKENSWSVTNLDCPAKDNFAVCKSRVVTEYLYEDALEYREKWKHSSEVTCESSGRRYIALD